MSTKVPLHFLTIPSQDAPPAIRVLRTFVRNADIYVHSLTPRRRRYAAKIALSSIKFSMPNQTRFKHSDKHGTTSSKSSQLREKTCRKSGCLIS